MITIRELIFSYKKQPLLYNRLSLDIESGSITGLLGKNGAGKTSLLKLMSGLLTPDSGQIRVLDQHPKKRNPSFLEKIFFVPEEFHLPSVSIFDFINANYGFYPDFDRALMENLLENFELSPSYDIHRISYGQKKKFLISFCLATKCKLLLLDEPTNGLDIPSKSVFRKIMASSLDDGQLVIISTHQVRDVENLIDRIIILDEGRVILKKDTYEIAEQIQFSESPVPDGEHVLYSETAPGGYRIISPRTREGSSIDIELLFNAVTQGKKIFSNHENI